MQVRSTTKYARISPKKARDVAREIQGLPVSDALDALTYTPRKAAHLVGKARRGGIANAENSHGHSAGGTNPSLVEIMHFSKPIAAFDCSFNRATMEDKGNYFSSSKGLAKILGESNSLVDGNAMAEIAKRRYTWEIIRKQYLELFTT